VGRYGLWGGALNGEKGNNMTGKVRQKEIKDGLVAVGDTEWAWSDEMTVAQWRLALAVTERWPSWEYADSQRRIATNMLRLAAERGLSDDDLALKAL
jgi:hypothetical protein